FALRSLSSRTMTSVSAASSSNRFMRRLLLFRECRLEPVDKEFDRFWSGSAIRSESDGSKLQLPLHVGGPLDLRGVSSIPATATGQATQGSSAARTISRSQTFRENRVAFLRK